MPVPGRSRGNPHSRISNASGVTASDAPSRRTEPPVEPRTGGKGAPLRAEADRVEDIRLSRVLQESVARRLQGGRFPGRAPRRRLRLPPHAEHGGHEPARRRDGRGRRHEDHRPPDRACLPSLRYRERRGASRTPRTLARNGRAAREGRGERFRGEHPGAVRRRVGRIAMVLHSRCTAALLPPERAAAKYATPHCAPIAQLDRASDYESEGRVFESPWAHSRRST